MFKEFHREIPVKENWCNKAQKVCFYEYKFIKDAGYRPFEILLRFCRFWDSPFYLIADEKCNFWPFLTSFDMMRYVLALTGRHIYIYKKVCYYLVNAIGGEWIGKNGKMPRRGTGKWSTLRMAYISNHFLKFYIHILITFKVDLLNKQSILSKGYIFKQIKPCRN